MDPNKFFRVFATLILFSALTLSCDPEDSKEPEYSAFTGYTVTLKFNDEKTPDQEIPIAKGAKMGANLPLPSRAGFNFENWFVVKTKKVFDRDTLITENIVLYAKWNAVLAADEFTVTLEFNDGKTGVMTLKVKDGETLGDRLPTSTKVGHDFGHWRYKERAEVFSKDTAVTKNITLIPVWHIKTFKLTFALKGGTFTNDWIAEFSVSWNETTPAPTVDAPDKVKQVLAGWFDKANDAKFDFATPITKPYDFYAKYRDRKTLKVTFAPRGGKFTGSAALASVTKDFTEGVTITQPTQPTDISAPAKNQLTGWYRQTDDSQFDFATDTATQNIILYAKWKSPTKADLSALIKPLIQADPKVDLTHIDVSAVTDMQGLFDGSNFNGDISNWDVSSVTTMKEMFDGSKFTGDISKWKTSSVTNMALMFANSSFAGDISNWNTSAVQGKIGISGMHGMFLRNKAFQGNIKTKTLADGSLAWDVSKVVNISEMFNKAAFNPDISKWDVSSITMMNNTFSGNKAFNRDLSKWCFDAGAGVDRAGFDTGATAWKLAKPTFKTCPPKPPASSK